MATKKTAAVKKNGTSTAKKMTAPRGVVKTAKPAAKATAAKTATKRKAK